MANPRRRLRTGQELSAAEWAWLSGERRADYDDWDAFEEWSLNHGYPSHHKGRAITAAQLVSSYGELVSPARRRVLQQKIDARKNGGRPGA